MRRSMDLIRELMLRLEQFPLKTGMRTSVSADEPRLIVEGYSPDEIAYHLDQIRQTGFVNDGGVRPAIGIGFAGLTPAGHEFLDAVREPKVWIETKSRAEKVGGWSIGILTDLAKGYIKAKAAEHGFPMG